MSTSLGGLWGKQSAGVEQDGQMSLVVFSLNFALVGGITFAENWLKFTQVGCCHSTTSGLSIYLSDKNCFLAE